MILLPRGPATPRSFRSSPQPWEVIKAHLLIGFERRGD
jgi:hypothetical protein